MLNSPVGATAVVSLAIGIAAATGLFSIVNASLQLRRNVRQPDQVAGDDFVGHKVERWSGTGEEWRATAEHDGVEVESIFIDQAGLRQCVRQDRSANENFAGQIGLQPAYHLFEVSRDERGVGAD